MGKARPSLRLGRRLRFKGTPGAFEDVSAVAFCGEHLLLAADEATPDPAGHDEDALHNRVEIYAPRRRHRKHSRYKRIADIALPLPEGEELDIEALAVDPDTRTVFVAGSHSAKRRRVKADKSAADNRARLSVDGIVAEPFRRGLFRFRLTEDLTGVDGTIDRLDLWSALEGSDVLAPFLALPSKENGVDLEGLALGPDGWLWVGFRGPVLRGNWVPVMRFDPRSGEHALRFVTLGGRGIRAIARITDGFLLVAGPVGDQDWDHRLYYWDGGCLLPGDRTDDATPGRLVELAAIDTPPDGRPEGLAVRREDRNGSTHCARLVIAYDGVTRLDHVARRARLVWSNPADG
ncbi:MAG: DUF3616 domain-containing protein [Pseudomonadota bacterium]